MREYRENLVPVVTGGEASHGLKRLFVYSPSALRTSTAACGPRVFVEQIELDAEKRGGSG